MNVTTRPLLFDPTQLRGLSEALIRSHYENNYSGAVKKLNAIRSNLLTVDFQKLPAYQLNGLKREELIAANSAFLHEIYFANLGDKSVDIPAPFNVALAANFGSVERWTAEFTAMGRALSGGSGWVILSFSPQHGTLCNQWASDHTHILAGSVPILALDMYEHAYHIDFGAQAGAYVDAYMNNIRWDNVHQLYQKAVHDASEPFSVAHTETTDAVVIDVRRTAAFKQASDLIEGAMWRDPALVSEWQKELDPARKVILYCVAGHEISRATTMLLRTHGYDAMFINGGIEGWKAQGRPITLK